MSASAQSTDINSVINAVLTTPPFSLLDNSQKSKVQASASLVACSVGERIIRLNSFSSSIYLVVSGKVRLLTETNMGSKTLAVRGRGQLFGWSSLLCAEPFEWVTSSEESTLLQIPSSIFIDVFFKNKEFSEYFSGLRNIHELFSVIKIVDSLTVYRDSDLQEYHSKLLKNASFCSISQGSEFHKPDQSPSNLQWFLSSNISSQYPAGYLLKEGDLLPRLSDCNLPIDELV